MLNSMVGPAARDTVGVSPALILVLTVLLHSCVISDKLLDLSGLQFLCLSNKIMIHTW